LGGFSLGRMVDKMIDAKIKIHCTDNGKDVEAHILNYKPRAFLEVAFQTVKLRMVYKENTRVFFGSLMGREFVIKEDDLPKDYKEYQR
jgi:hypothetical protein